MMVSSTPLYRGSLDLAVVESRWWTTGNQSVKAAFDLLAGIVSNNPYGYHYEMFSNRESLQEILPRVAKDSRIHYIYIAAHGDERSIFGADDQRISRTILTNILMDIHAQELHGLYFGSCLFGEQTDDLIQRSGTTWIAGYVQEIGWMESTALDLYFWNAYFRSGVSRAKTKSERAQCMLRFLFALWMRIPYMFKEMGFRTSVYLDGRCVTFPDDIFGTSPENAIKKEYRDLHRSVSDLIDESFEAGDFGRWP